jgi:1-deoxy-D-xylulose-5-phosphate synthase
MRFVKPLDLDIIKEMLLKTKKFITIEENVLTGGFGYGIKAFLHDREAVVECVGLPDQFIEHGDLKILRKKYGLTSESIAEKAFQLLKTSK